MKKVIIGICAVTLLAGVFYLYRYKLTGLFGLRSGPSGTQGTMTSTLPPEPAIVPKTPSFQDGDYYIKALSDKNLALCDNIKNDKLRARCGKDAK